jgi:DNA-damage-inducible protein D
MQLDLVISALNDRRKLAPNGQEYWMARDLLPVLGYSNWQNFRAVLEKAKMACDSSGAYSSDHFIETSKVMTGGKGAQIQREDYYLSRYACYLIAMNGDSSKPEIGTAQTYFAVQTRRQEKFDQLTEEERRVELRERVRIANYHLAGAAKGAGVQNYGIFQDAGYNGLYGMGSADIKLRKGIPSNESLLDCAGRAELAANEFRITQTEQKIKREEIQGEAHATMTHHEVGKEVRATIQKIGGTMPENLAAETSIKKLKANRKRLQRQTNQLLSP